MVCTHRMGQDREMAGKTVKKKKTEGRPHYVYVMGKDANLDVIKGRSALVTEWARRHVASGLLKDNRGAHLAQFIPQETAAVYNRSSRDTVSGSEDAGTQDATGGDILFDDLGLRIMVLNSEALDDALTDVLEQINSRIDRQAFTRAFDRLLREERASLAIGSVMADEEEISPQRARSLQATVNRIRAAFSKYGVYTAKEVGELLGATGQRPGNLATERHKAGELLAIETRGGNKYPGFQFRGNEVLPIIKQLRATAEQGGWEEYDLFMWLIAPDGYLDRAIPADLLADESQHDRLLSTLAIQMSDKW